ncbi:hypothetical protein B0H12DRAFT_686527 [Mycena haematopus]|nr:hypothetical protein B0H12DRAFT_686527 [Mycena haematopus]
MRTRTFHYLTCGILYRRWRNWCSNIPGKSMSCWFDRNSSRGRCAASLWFIQFDPNSRFIFGTTETLEHVAFDLKDLETPISDLVPSLPRLRSVEFSLPFRSHAASWFLPFAVALLDASPLLVDVKISFSSLSIENADDNSPPHIIGRKLMTALDDASASHSACHAIRGVASRDAKAAREGTPCG